MRAAVVVVLLAVHNLVTNLWFPDRWYVPVNLAHNGLLPFLPVFNVGY